MYSVAIIPILVRFAYEDYVHYICTLSRVVICTAFYFTNHSGLIDSEHFSLKTLNLCQFSQFFFLPKKCVQVAAACVYAQYGVINGLLTLGLMGAACSVIAWLNLR